MKKKKVLILVDYQWDFIEGVLGFESGKDLDKILLKKVKEYLEDPDCIVVVTFDTHTEKYLETLEGKKLPVPHCLINSDGWKLYGRTGEYIYSKYSTMEEYIGSGDRCAYTTDNPNLYLVTKPGFGSVELGDLLRAINTHDSLESIEVTGVVTNMCVISNVVIAKAACPNVEIIVTDNEVDSFDKVLHNKALDVMEGMQVVVNRTSK